MQLNGVSLSAGTLPAGLTGQPGTVGNTCANGTVAFSGNALSYSGGTFAAGSSCTVTLGVTSTTPGSYTYTTGTPSAAGTLGNAFTLTGTPATSSPGLTVAASGNADLSNLLLSQGTLTPTFAAGTTSYSAAVSNGVTSLTVTPTAAAAGATITVNGTPVASGSPSGAIALAVGSNTIPVAVTAQDGTTSRTYQITVTRAAAAPSVATVAPNEGATAGGTAITITGSGFTGATGVTVGGGAATGVAVVSDTQITATTPPGTAGAAAVTVTTAAGTSNPNGSFTYVAPPTATNQSVTVPYQTAQAITLGASDPNGPPRTLTFTVVQPAHGSVSGSGANRTYTPATGYSGPDSFTFTASNGVATSNTATVSITVQAPVPTVTGVSPSQGSTAGGTAITITGSGFTGATAVTVGGTTATGVTVVSNTQITATTPAGTAGAAIVQVTNATGPSTTNGTFTYATPATANGQSVSTAFNTATQITLTASGTAPITYAVTSAPARGTLSGTAPGPLTYSPTPGYRGTDSFTFTASNGAGTSAPATVTITVGDPTITLTGPAPTGTRGTAYSSQVSAGGGTAPYSFAVTNGALPPGLTLGAGTATSRAITGTPTASGSFTFTITTQDSTPGNPPVTQSGSYTITVAAPTLTASPAAGALAPATAGQAYSRTLATAGGTAPYSYAISAGSLPSGLTLSAGGTIAGTPSQGGTFNFNVTATNSSSAGNGGPYTLTTAYSLSVNGATVVIGPATLSPAPQVGVAYSQTFTAGGGTGPYGFAATGALPTGLTLSPGGVLSGTPSAGGSFGFRVTATDAGGFAGFRDYTVTIAAPTLALAPATLPGADRNVGYSQILSASGGTAPYSYAVTAGALPAGITLAANGTLSGSPTAAGSYGFTVTATDASTGTGPYSVARAYTLTVSAVAISIAPTTLPAATTRIAYSQTLTASGGAAPYSYAVTAGALPAGITLGAGGTLAGTANTAGTYTFSVTAADANGNTGTQGYTLTVAAPAIVLAPDDTLPTATSRIAYSQALAASGGTAPYSFAVTAGALPAGITLSAGGTLSGTANTAGTYTFTVTAADANGNTGTQGYTLIVAAPAIALAPTTLADATAGAAYGTTIAASGGTAPYGYAVTAGALPAGLTLATDGTLAGTPTAGGSFAFTVRATDADGNAGSRGYTLVVAQPTIAIAPANLPAATANVAYSQALAASGGTAPYGYAVVAGALPAGVTLAASGTLAGTPTQGGSFGFTVRATDSSSGSGPYAGTRSYTLTVAAPAIALAPASLPAATIGQAYAQAIAASGGAAPYGYAVTAGALPAGVVLSSSGTLSGTPGAGGDFAFTVTATDANGNAGSHGYTLTVAPAAVTIAPASLPGGRPGVAYSQTLTASGGTAPYSYAITAGALPTGMTLSTSGTLAGTPTQSGSFTVAVTATDCSTGSGPYAGTRSYTLTIAAPTLGLSPAALANAGVGTAYSQTIVASGGTAPYGYAVTAGALPAGVTLSPSGVVSGTPSAGGSFGFTVTATDSSAAASGGPYSISRAYTLSVAAATVTVSPASLPGGQSGIAFGQTLTASGGTAPYSYAVTGGTLPAGVTLSTSGTLAGTPTQSGSFVFAVTATDGSTGSGPYAGTRSFTLTIAAPALSLAPATLPDGTLT